MAKSAVLTGKTTPPNRGTGKTLVQVISDPQTSAPCTSPNVYHSPDQENVAEETQMLQNGTSEQNEKSEQPQGKDYKKRTNLLRKIFCHQLSRKNKKICISVTVVVVLAVIVVVSIILTPYKEDKGGAAANGEEELDSKVLRSEFPGTGMTSVPTTTSYGDGDHADCSLVFINKEPKVFNDSQHYCETHNSRLLQERDLKAVGHCIPKGEDFWAKKGDDSAPGLCHIYNTEHSFVRMHCTTGRRCICVKDPNTTKKNEET